MSGMNDALGILAFCDVLKGQVADFIAVPSHTQPDYDFIKSTVTTSQIVVSSFRDPYGNFAADTWDPPIPALLSSAATVLTNCVNDLATYAGNNSLTP